MYATAWLTRNQLGNQNQSSSNESRLFQFLYCTLKLLSGNSLINCNSFFSVPVTENYHSTGNHLGDNKCSSQCFSLQLPAIAWTNDDDDSRSTAIIVDKCVWSTQRNWWYYAIIVRYRTAVSGELTLDFPKCQGYQFSGRKLIHFVEGWKILRFHYW